MSSNKSFSSETSERYARALYELTFDSNELKIVKKKVEEFLELYEKNNEFKFFFTLIISSFVIDKIIFDLVKIQILIAF